MTDLMLKVVPAVAEEFGSEVRFADGAWLDKFLGECALKVQTEPLTGIRSVVMKSAIFACSGKWPKEVRLG